MPLFTHHFTWVKLLRPLTQTITVICFALLGLIMTQASAEESSHTTLAPSTPSWDNLKSALQEDWPSFDVAPTEDLAQALPFTINASFSADTVHFELKLDPGAYLYRDSIKLSTKTSSVLITPPTLPESELHEDSMGANQVYFNELKFDVPIIKAQECDELILSYQGCDFAGICYPPQEFKFALPQKVEATVTQLDAVAVNEPNESATSFWQLLQNTDGTALSDFIAANLGIGLLLCFLLGIGLDLTPCVLPMLPIFSAMLVSRPKKGEAVNLGATLRQNAGYALGLSLSYMVLGLIFASLGASFHGILQHPAVTLVIALLLLICAIACAGFIELKVPNFITLPLQQKISALNTKSMGGAFALGVISAIVASPCTSAPLAGALLYVMQSGNTLLGALVFLVIGLGMATPLLLIGIFGGRFLMKGGLVGDLVKRVLALLLLFAAYFITRHLMGTAEPIIFALCVLVSGAYILGSVLYYVLKRKLTLTELALSAIIALAPSYLAYEHLSAQSSAEAPTLYQGFTKVTSLRDLNAATQGKKSFITFTAAWCTNCRDMAQNVYSKEEFLRATSDLSRVVVDITDTNSAKAQELIAHFKVIGVPYSVTLNQAGAEINSHIGLAKQEQVIKMVQELKEAAVK